MSGPEAIELTNTDEQTKALLEGRLRHMAGRVRRLLAERLLNVKDNGLFRALSVPLCFREI